MTKRTESKSNGDKISELEYDSNGNVTKNVSYSWLTNAGTVGQWVAYEYDDAGNKIDEIEYVGEGTDNVNTHKTYEYNDAGKVTKKTDYYGTDDMIGWTEYEYTQVN